MHYENVDCTNFCQTFNLIQIITTYWLSPYSWLLPDISMTTSDSDVSLCLDSSYSSSTTDDGPGSGKRRSCQIAHLIGAPQQYHLWVNCGTCDGDPSLWECLFTGDRSQHYWQVVFVQVRPKQDGSERNWARIQHYHSVDCHRMCVHTPNHWIDLIPNGNSTSTMSM